MSAPLRIVAEDPNSPRPLPTTLADRLKATGSKMSALSKKAAEATKEAVDKVATAGKDAVTKTNEAVSDAVEARKERKHDKLTEKIEQTKAELKDDGHIALAPAMITLPEFEEERMAVMAEEHDILVDLVDQMVALSKRTDLLQKKYNSLAYEEKDPLPLPDSETTKGESIKSRNHPMNAVLSMLGASLLWVVILTGIDRHLATDEVMVFTDYPAQIPIWGIGAGTWVIFVLHQLGKTAPLLRVPTPMLIQTGLAVGVTTVMALLLSDDTITAMSSLWTWGTAVAIVALLSANLIGFAWRTTSELLAPNETSEIIK